MNVNCFLVLEVYSHLTPEARKFKNIAQHFAYDLSRLSDYWRYFELGYNSYGDVKLSDFLLLSGTCEQEN